VESDYIIHKNYIVAGNATVSEFSAIGLKDGCKEKKRALKVLIEHLPGYGFI